MIPPDTDEDERLQGPVFASANSRFSQARLDETVGRPPHERNDSIAGAVSLLASFRIAQHKIARFMRMDPKTLRKYYQEELDNAETIIDAEVLKAWLKLIQRCDPLTVNRYMERKFKLNEMDGVATELPSVQVIDNLPRVHNALPQTSVPEQGTGGETIEADAQGVQPQG